MGNKERKSEPVETSHDDHESKPDRLTNEAQKGMSGLLNDRQKLIQHLKEGGKSGITDDFGKPTVEGAETEQKKARPRKHSEAKTEEKTEEKTDKKHDASEKPEQKQKPGTEDKKDDWEVKPHFHTKVAQDHIGSLAVVTEIAFPPHLNGIPGGSRKFEHDKDANLTKVTEPDGSSFEKVKGADGKEHWAHKYPPGVRALDPAEYNVTVDNAGNLKIENKTEGTSRVEYKDGHAVDLDKKGRVTEVDYLNKNPEDAKTGGDGNRHFKYNDKGEISEYTAPNGSHWKTSDGEHWQKVDKNGNPIPGKDNTLEGKMSVTEDGNFKFENHREPKHTTEVTVEGRRINHYDAALAQTDNRVGQHHLSPKEQEQALKELKDDIAYYQRLPILDKAAGQAQIAEHLKRLHNEDFQSFDKIVRELEKSNPELFKVLPVKPADAPVRQVFMVDIRTGRFDLADPNTSVWPS